MDAPENQQPAETGTDQDSLTIAQCLAFLRRKDDTSRFAGLAMLSSLLNHIQDPDILSQFCEALDPKFLDRLLKAGSSTKKSPEEAKDMIELAVNVIHALATLLPESAENESLVARAPLLLNVLPQVSTITAATILQTLLVFATGVKGAQAILSTAASLKLFQLSVEHETALQVIQYAFVNSRSAPAFLEERLGCFLPEISDKLATEKNPLRLQILSFLSDLLTRIPSQLLPNDTDWVKVTYKGLQTIIASTHSSKERSHATIIAAALLHKYSPNLLFEMKSFTKAPSSSEKPFIYFFLKLVLIDIRTSFPAIFESLASPSYGAMAHRLSADFDVIAAFLGYLVMLEDFEDLAIETDLLLKLRTDIGETFGLTIEFLRDRWDASYAGAAGFEPGYEKDVPLSLTWESTLEGGLEKDPLVIAAVRALSLWLREDDGLREEAGGLTDCFLGLWKKGMEAGVDYRIWIIGAFEGTVEERNGREMFVKEGGWDVVWNDLKAIYLNSSSNDEELRLALYEARVLTEVVRLEGAVEEKWAREVATTANIKRNSEIGRKLDGAVMRLSSMCLANVHKAVSKKLEAEVEKIQELCQTMMMDAGGCGGQEEILEVVMEVVEELEALEL